MSDLDPIRQPIKIDADTSGAREAADATKDYAQQVEESGKKTGQQADATKRSTDATKDNERATRRSKESQRDSNRTVADSVETLGLLAAAYATANDLIDEYNLRIERSSEKMRENAAIARENAEARLDLIALQGVESVEDLNRITLAASFSGRRPGEVAQGEAFAKSQLPNATAEELLDLQFSVAAAARISTAPTNALYSGILPIFKKTGDTRVASNIFQEAITQAGEVDPGKLGEAIAANLEANQAIGATDIGETVGLIAGATGVGLKTDVAQTALRAANFAIRGKGTPEGNKILDRLNIDRSSLLTALPQLRDARLRGELSPADLESLGGREAAPLFAILTDDAQYEKFITSVRAVDAAEDYRGNLAKEKAQNIFTPGSLQSSNLLSKSFESEKEGIQAGDAKAANIEAYRKGLDTLLEAELAKPEGGDLKITPDLAQRIKDEYEYQIGKGKSPAEAIRIAESVPRSYATIPGVEGPVRGPRGEIEPSPFSQEGIYGHDGLPARDGYFSGPLEEVIKDGPSKEPELLRDRANDIRNRDGEGSDAPFGGEIEDVYIGPWKVWSRDPKNQQGAATGQGIDMAAVVASMDRLNDTLIRMEQMPQQAARTINFNGPYNAGDPMVDDLDGRDRFG